MLVHCGQCNEFPCELLIELSYEKKKPMRAREYSSVKKESSSVDNNKTIHKKKLPQ